MDNFRMSMKKIKGIKQLNNCTLYKMFVEAIRSEYRFHVTKTHLRRFQDKDDMFAIWTDNFEGVQQFAYVIISLICTFRVLASKMAVKWQFTVN